jgi:TolB-like protein/Tfp pilus assembly protein PilF
MRKFFQELKRRNVVKAAITYGVVSWALLQVSDILFSVFDIPSNSLRYVIYVLMSGFPIWLVLAYVFEWTTTRFDTTTAEVGDAAPPRQPSSLLNTLIMSGLVIAVSLLVVDRFLNPNKNSLAPITDKSIAVIPFRNMSSDQDQEYFSDGLSEELIILLTKIPDLKVIARTSSFAFKGKDEDLRIIGEKLGVANLLEGSVRKSGNRLRITVQLIKAEDGSHLWSEIYDRTLDDIFSVQDEIAAAVVTELKVTLLKNANNSMNPEAYNLYLEGKFLADTRSKQNFELAIDKLKQALAMDSTAEQIWAELGSVYSYQAGYGYIPTEEGYALARQASERALHLNPDLAETWDNLGWISMYYDLDFSKADAAFKRVLEIDPANASALNNSAAMQSCLGKVDEAIALYNKAISADPLRPAGYNGLSLEYFYKGDWEKSEEAMEKVLEITPDYSSAYYQLARIQLAQGDGEDAIETLKKEADELWKLAGLSLAYSQLHQEADAKKALQELIDKYTEGAAYQIAATYASRGEIDSAFEWLERAYQQRDGGLTEIMADPTFKSLQKDSRWKPFLQRMKLVG